MADYSFDDLARAFRELGIGRGDVVLFQSCLFGLGRPTDPQNLPQLMYRAILDAIGDEGTLAVYTPTTQIARNDLIFDVNLTKSNYGAFPNYILGREGVVRSLHPLRSMAAIGKLKYELCRSPHSSDFGHNSPFDMLLRHSAKNLLVGAPMDDSLAFTHYIEMRYGVPYLYHKLLKWRAVENGVALPNEFVTYARYLNYQVDYNLHPFIDDLYKEGKVKSADVGKGKIFSVDLQSQLEVGLKGLEKDIFYFLRLPPDFVYGEVPFDGPSLSRETVRDFPKSITPAGEEIGRLETALEKGRSSFPFFTDLLSGIVRRSPEFKVRLASYLSGKFDGFWKEAEAMAAFLEKSARKSGLPLEQIADEFLEHVAVSENDLGGKLRSFDGDRLFGEIISNYLSEWPYRLLLFAKMDFFVPYGPTSSLHVEVGAQNGWFPFLAFHCGAKNLLVLDDNRQALDRLKLFFSSLDIPEAQVEFEAVTSLGDSSLKAGSADTLTAKNFSRATNGPSEVLREARRILKRGGMALFASDLSQVAADERSRLDNMNSIRDYVSENGFKVERSIVLPPGPPKREGAKSEKLAALVARKV